MISEHLSEWFGLPVEQFQADEAESTPPDYANRIYRLTTDWESEYTFAELFERFTSNPACSATKAIVIGAFHGDDPGQNSEETVQLLVASRRLFHNLRGIFLGDIVGEENEISWINQSDVSPIFTAYPALQEFRVRGGTGLSFGGGVQHEALKTLVIESGGTSANTIREILASRLPRLEHLEIWTGDPNYGGDSSVEDLRPLWDGTNWPALKHLALRDSPYADEIAIALKDAPIADRLEVLDLSLGTLGDAGGEALLANPRLGKLRKLDLHHNYLSADMMKKLEARFPEVKFFSPDYDVRDDDEDERYVAVGE
jgi:hypothetical protein